MTIERNYVQIIGKVTYFSITKSALQNFHVPLLTETKKQLRVILQTRTIHY